MFAILSLAEEIDDTTAEKTFFLNFKALLHLFAKRYLFQCHTKLSLVIKPTERCGEMLLMKNSILYSPIKLGKKFLYQKTPTYFIKVGVHH